MLPEGNSEIGQTGEATKLTHFGDRVFSRLQQFYSMIEPDGFDEICGRLVGERFNLFIKQRGADIHCRGKFFLTEFGIGNVGPGHFHHFFYKFIVEFIFQNMFGCTTLNDSPGFFLTTSRLRMIDLIR